MTILGGSPCSGIDSISAPKGHQTWHLCLKTLPIKNKGSNSVSRTFETITHGKWVSESIEVELMDITTVSLMKGLNYVQATTTANGRERARKANVVETVCLHRVYETLRTWGSLELLSLWAFKDNSFEFPRAGKILSLLSLFYSLRVEWFNSFIKPLLPSLQSSHSLSSVAR